MERERMLQDAADFLRAQDDFLLLTHIQPDGDAIGSLLGFAHLLQSLGKQFQIAGPEPIPEKFCFLPMADRFQMSAEIKRKFPAAVVLDCGDRTRIGQCEELLAQDAVLLNIDHHKTNDSFGLANLVDVQSAATSQIVYSLARHMGLEIGRQMAICLYTGILTDTGGFRYSNTSAEVHRIAADLLQKGVAPYDVADRVLETLTWFQVQLIREALGTLQRDDSGQLAWVVVRRDLLARLGAADEDAEGLVNYARNVEGVEVGILFREKGDGSIKVSFRSKYRIDVGEIALFFGGGGHARASGCTLHGPIEKVQSVVLAKVREFL